MTQYNLGHAYHARILGERAENLELAVAYYERALQVRTQGSFPEQWAMTQNSLSSVSRSGITWREMRSQL
ncbi:tetratricopeptide repeat protein [Microcoleus sp. AS-A8]